MEDSSTPPDNETNPREFTRPERPSRRSRERKKRRVPPPAVKRNYLLHILFYDRAFRWLAVVGILLFGGMAVIWPRIFVTSPEGFYPVIRVNGIDLLKARSLRKAAQAAEAAGRNAEAIQTWMAALSSNEADPELNRGLLKALAAQKTPDLVWLKLVNRSSDWLLQLAGTNHSDLEIAARANAVYGQWDWIISRVGATNAPRTDVTTPVLLAALFEKGQVARFAEEWAAHGAQAAGNRDAALYHAAWQAGWGPADQYRGALERLEAAAQVPESQDLALRMLMRVAFQQVDLASYERNFARLRDLHGDRLRHHVRHWHLLLLSGQRQRALDAAGGFGELPATVEEADLYVTTLAELKLAKPIVEFARTKLKDFAASPLLWVRTAAALMQVEDWDELRALAVELRQQDLLSPVLGNYSWFLEGLGEHKLGRRPRAESGFDRYLERPATDPALNFQAAVLLGREGYPERATRLLRTLETAAGNAPDLWAQLQRSAYESRDVEVLVEASRRLFELRPNDPQVANNYAASLLLTGDRKAEAVQVTLDVLNRQPASVAARINRAQALIQIGRAEEAGPLLTSLEAANLEASHQNSARLVRFLYHEALGQKAEALAVAGKIEPRFLFPPQVLQLNESVAKLRAAK